uniref:Short coiled-coil protein n=1 Tax=Timema poppense TaxID=170557 RepID=A0A7R9DJM2_TIMPO|nr:unnamed protein product [Timema poppensis]
MSVVAGAKMQEEMNNIPLADDDPQAIIHDDTENTEISDAMMRGLDPDISPDEQEEKARLISQVLELQNTLDDLSQRVDSVKEENLKLRSENQVLGQYIENLMSASSVFQSTSPKTKKK